MGRKGEGQWATGNREPLNDVERLKQDDDGLNVRQRIIDQYSKEGFDSIHPDDLRGRFRWWGLYTQRTAGATGDVEEVEDSHFMMRVRIPGGRLTSDQLRTIAGISQRYGRDFADVTDRSNVQFHWIRIEDVPAIWEQLEAVGLQTAEACGDVPRTTIGCPLAGVDARELIDASPFIDEIERRFVGDPRFSNLPRKYKTSISGCADHCAEHEINDIAFIGVRHGDGRVGFDLWVGGGLGPAPRMAQRLGVFVPPERVVEVWLGVTSVFRDHGFRGTRNSNRFKFLVGEVGPERIREILETEYLETPLEDGPEAIPSASAQRDHIGIVEQSDGRVYVGAAPRAGRSSGPELERVAELADEYGSGRIRLTTQQKIVILDVEPDRAEALADKLEAMDLQVRPSELRRGAMACTGIEFCKIAVTETKGRTDRLIREIEQRIPEFDQPIRIHMNGCPNSCARVQLADIGLLGSLVPGPDGERVPGYQVLVGGHLGPDAEFGRRPKGVRVPSDRLEDYIEGVLRRFLDTREPDEPFHVWSARADPDWLQLSDPALV